MKNVLLLSLLFSALAPTSAARAAGDAASLSAVCDRATDALFDYYESPDASIQAPTLAIPPDLLGRLNPDARQVLAADAHPSAALPLRVGELRGRAQQAMVLQMADAVRRGEVATAQAWRVQLALPRGVSATEGELLLDNLPAGETQRADAARVLVREAITWQTARVRQLLADATRAAEHVDLPMPGRLSEELGEASVLANLPLALVSAAALPAASTSTIGANDDPMQFASIDWPNVSARLAAYRHDLESHLPSLLSPQERARRERMLLKLVAIIPKEYSAGVRDGKVSVPLEYREAVTFTAQAREFLDELTPVWLANDPQQKLRDPLARLELSLGAADQLIAKVQPIDQVTSALKQAQSLLEGPFNLSLHRGGTTADIVDEVLLDTRRLLGESLASANNGNWREAESQRLEAYTTYDPDVEGRLMPRDPQLATDIERLLLDGLDQPGVKALLDRRIAGAELEAAYARVNRALDRAAALLKSGVSPAAAAINAGSIVLREGLEGLLVIIAILAGLRGAENRRKRLMVWNGVALSMLATIATVILSQTLLTRLHAYGELIEAITSILAIGVLLLITNWLFHQIYWRQWVCTLKEQSTSENAWQLITVGFLIGYREGFETVLFLQSMMLDVGGVPISIGVGAGLIILIALGWAALVMGLKMPYFKLLLGTAGLIGAVLIMFVGTGVRSMQTVGWLPVHKLIAASWPTWVGQWLGIYNSYETIGAQLGAATLVLGTMVISRWRSKRAALKRRTDRLTIIHTTTEIATTQDCQLDFNDPLAPCPADKHRTNGEPIEKPAVTVTVRGRAAAKRDAPSPLPSP